MRKVVAVVLLIAIVVPTIRCSDEESLERLPHGLAVVTSDPIHWAHILGADDSLFGVCVEGDSLTVDTDSITWVFDPTGATSNLSIVIRARDTVHPLNRLPAGALDAALAPVLAGLDSTAQDSVKARVLDSARVQWLLGLGVETYVDGVPDTVFIAPDSMGLLYDTVQIAFSPVSGVIVPSRNSRLIITRAGAVVGSVDLVNPW